jgi:hypothetical protein
LVAVEAQTRFGVAELLRTKDEAMEVLKNIVAKLEHQSGLRLKKLRTDSGTEFVNQTIRQFCERNGIAHETTAPHTPEQNGIAERRIKTCVEMVRCMLHSAGMDLRYWGEAFMYAMHIRNLSPTSAVHGLVPYEAWTGRKPDVSHLRIFGSLAFAHIPKAVRGGKLEQTAIKCRMMGWWADETKGYRLEDMETGRLITSRDVRFIEDERPNNLPTIDEREVSSPYAQDSDASSEDEPAVPQKEGTLPEKETPTSEVQCEEPRQETVKGRQRLNLPPREQPARIRKAPGRLADAATEEDIARAVDGEQAHWAYIALGGEPNTFQQAKQSDHAKQWEEAIAREYEQLVRSGTIEWVRAPPPGRTAIGSKVVFKEKKDADGNTVKFKARIVAKGYSQIPGLDFEQTSATVARFTTLRTLLSLAAREDWEVHHVDVVGAYLNGDLKEELYMEVPDGVDTTGRKGWCWRLRRPLYGLKQAGRQWKVKLDDALRQIGLEKSNADDSLYVLEANGQVALIVLVYVDDMAIAAQTKASIVDFKTKLTRMFEITDLGSLRHMLGLQIVRDRAKQSITITQTTYIRTVLKRYGMEDCAPVSTPLTVKASLSKEQSPANEEEKRQYAEVAKGFSYAECLGAVLYMTQTRPDIQYAVGICSQFTSNPGKAHLVALKRILRYLKGTMSFGLVLGRKNGTDLVGWTDSDWGQDADTRRSTGGFVFDVAGGIVSWSSKKQPTVALSTVEAEYMAAANATREAIWLRTLLEDLGFQQTSATVIHADNQGCISLTHGPTAHSRTKHIDLRHHFIREKVANQEVTLKYCQTQRMLADILTKQLPREAFERFREALGVVEMENSPSGSDERSV